MKRISIVTPCYNEEENVEELYRQVRAVTDALPSYEWEHLFIDNASVDGTVAKLKILAAADPRLKIIVNTRNFGHIRSPFHGLLQTSGDAAISLVADLQDPPSLIPAFLEKWEAGCPVVLGQKISSDESKVLYLLRTAYYKIVRKLSEVQLIDHVTGFGLFDRKVIEVFRQIDDPYPYARGMICDLGFAIERVPYRQPERKRGLTKNNFYTLYDMAMLGITSHSKVPLRLATLIGFILALMSLLVAFIYFVYKLIYWGRFPAGQAPEVIGLFLFSSVQLFFIGVLGEYIAAIHTQILHRPLVIEKERINFPESK